MTNTIIKAIKFYAISFTGWALDFSIFSLLTHFTAIPLAIANIISSTPSITLIFFVSTKHIFCDNKTHFSTRVKYGVYIIYQSILLVSVSFFAQFLFTSLTTSPLYEISILSNFGELLAKIVVAPISLFCNYCFMKFLVERL